MPMMPGYGSPLPNGMMPASPGHVGPMGSPHASYRYSLNQLQVRNPGSGSRGSEKMEELCGAC